MSDPRTDGTDDRRERPRDAQSVEYPQNRMLAILDNRDDLRSAIDALTDSGFLASEIAILHGRDAATRLQEETGRRGLANLAMRFAEAIQLPNDEAALKSHYADALANKRFIISVLALSEERQRIAARVLQEHGGSDVHFFSRFTITPQRAD